MRNNICVFGIRGEGKNPVKKLPIHHRNASKRIIGHGGAQTTTVALSILLVT